MTRGKYAIFKDDQTRGLEAWIEKLEQYILVHYCNDVVEFDSESGETHHILISIWIY